MAAVLAHRGDHRVVLAAQVPHRFEHLAALVELQHAAGVDVGEQPFVARHALGHAAAKARHLPRQVERRAAHADQRHPVVAVGRVVDVVREARQVVEHQLGGALLRPVEPVALDGAAPGLGEQERLAVAGDAHAVGKLQVAQHGVRLAVARVVADDAAVAARLEAVGGPLVHLVAHGGLGEEDAAVVGDVEVVGQAQAAVVVDRRIAAVGLVGHLLDLALGRHPVQPHAADAHVEVVVLVERHAQRRAADVRIDLHALVVGRKEPHDVAVARAGVQVVVAVEDHVFRAFDAAQADDLDALQLVVQRPRRAAVGRRRRRRRHAVVGGADVDLVDDAVLVLQPADVDHRGQQQDGGQHHAVVAAVQRHRGQAVDDQQHDQRAHQRLHHRTLAAAEADAAEHARRQHGDLEADADVAAGGGQARGEEDAAHRREHAAGHVAQRHRAPHRDAGVVGRAARAADRDDVPARAQPGQEDVAEDRDQRVDEHHRRHAEPGAAADEVPHLRVGKAGGDQRRVVGDQQVVQRAVDDQRDQRGEKGAQPEVADQHAVDRTEQRAEHQRGHHRAGDRPLQHVHEVQRAEVRQREHRPHRQVDAADDHHQRHAEHDEADLAGLPAGVGQARRREEVRYRAGQSQRDTDQHDHRNGGLHPALGEDLAQHVVGPPAVAQPGQPVAERERRRVRRVGQRRRRGRGQRLVHPASRVSSCRASSRSLRPRRWPW